MTTHYTTADLVLTFLAGFMFAILIYAACLVL